MKLDKHRIRIFAWGVEEEYVQPNVVAALREVKNLQRGEQGTFDNPPRQEVPDEVVKQTLPFIQAGFNTDAFDAYIADYLAGRESINMPKSINPKYKQEWIKLHNELNDLCVRYQEMLELKLKKTFGECLTPDGMLWNLRHGGERLLIFLVKLESKPDFLLEDVTY